MWSASTDLPFEDGSNSWTEFGGNEMIKSEQEESHPQFSEGGDSTLPDTMSQPRICRRKAPGEQKTRKDYNKRARMSEEDQALQRQKEREQRNKMSEEEKELKRQKGRERASERRATASEEDTALRLQRERERARQRRAASRARMSEEDRELMLQRERDRTRQRRAVVRARMSEEDRELILQRERERERQRRAAVRAGMSEEDRELMLQRERKRERQRRAAVRARMSEEDRELMLQRVRDRVRQRRAVARARMSEEDRELMLQRVRERERQRRAAVRAGMSEEDRELILQRKRERAHQRRAGMSEEDKGLMRRQWQKQREKHRGPDGRSHLEESQKMATGSSQSQNQEGDQEDSNSNPTTLSNSRRKNERNCEDYIKSRACTRIITTIDRALTTEEEKVMIVELRNWRKQKRQQQETSDERQASLDCPEVEEGWAWKEYICVQLKYEFRTRRNSLCEEALEIEVGPSVPFTESPLSSEYWSCVPNSSVEMSGGDTTNERETVRNRWKGVINNEENDQHVVPISSVSCNSYNDQVKIEVEEYNRDDSNSLPNFDDTDENEVADWIAHVVTDDNQSVTQPADVTAGQEQGQNVRLEYFRRLKNIAKQQRAEFVAARQRWITSHPKDGDKRAQLDKDRDALKERLTAKKVIEVERIRNQLIHQRDCYSQESEANRKVRIAELYKAIDSNINHVRQYMERIRNQSVISAEEKRKIAANAAKLRIRMERAEYELHLILISAVGLSTSGYRRFKTYGRSGRLQWAEPLPDMIGTISVQHFETALRTEINVESIVYFSKRKSTQTYKKTRVEVTCYRKLLEEFLSTRRKKVNDPSLTQEPQTAAATENVQIGPSLYEWISPIPESQSLQDVQRFKDFIEKYGPIVKEHLAFKAFFGADNFYKHVKNYPPDKKVKYAEKNNYYVRKRYIKKKYGVDLGPGEYFDKKTMSSVPKPPRAQYGSKRRAKTEHANTTCEAQKNLENENSTPRHSRVAKKKLTPTSLTTDCDQFQHPSLLTNQLQPDTRPITITSPDDSNDMDLSNSSNLNDIATSSRRDSSDEDDGWVPLGSYEIDSVIRNDILNLPNTGINQYQIHQNLNCPPQSIPCLPSQQYHGSRMQLRSGTTINAHSKFSQNQYRHSWGIMPHLQPLDGLPILNQNYMNADTQSQMPWNQNHHQENTQNVTPPLNYSLQLLSNSAPHQQPYADWNHANSQPLSSSKTMSNPMPILQPQIQPTITQQQQHNNNSCQESTPSPRNSDFGDASSVESPSLSPSPPKKKRGRPIGWSKTSANSTVTTSSSYSKPIFRRNRRCPGEQKRRDVWNNFKRNKFYGLPTVPRPRIPVKNRINGSIESPFERDPVKLQIQNFSRFEHLFPKKCAHCEEVLGDATAMKKHLDINHSKKSDLAEPTTDIEIAPTSSDGIKKQRKLMRLPCGICSNKYEVTTLIRHLLTNHYEMTAQIDQMSCPLCTGTECANILFDNEKIRKHLRSNHSKEMESSWIMEVSTIQAIAEKDKYFCSYCGQSYPTYDDLKRHCKETHDKVRFCCVYCGIYVKKQNFLIDHTKLFHPEKPLRSLPIPHVEIEEQDIFRCVECESEFSAQSFLDEHRKSQGHTLIGSSTSIPIIQRFSCPACNRELPSEKRTQEHFKKCNHRSYECFWCKRQWSSKAAVSNHIAEFHPLEPPVPQDHKEKESYMLNKYKCELCTRAFSALQWLRLHCIKEHELFKYIQEKKLPVDVPQQVDAIPEIQIETNSTATPTPQGNKGIPCPICKSPFVAHKVHKEFDNLMKRYCIPCDRLLSRPIVLVLHNEVAHGIVAKAKGRRTLVEQTGRTLDSGSDDVDANSCVTCHCGRSFAPQKFHDGHIFVSKHSNSSRSTDTNVLQPEDCDKLAAITTLSISNSSEITIYSCRVCLKNYSTLQFLQVHISNDHAKDAFTRVLCKLCNSTFSSKSLLKKHEKFNHSQARMVRARYQCSFCDLTFSNRDKLTSHCKGKHPDQKFIASDVKTVKPHTNVDKMKEICKICSMTFGSEIRLKSHMAIKHPPFDSLSFCAVCGLQIGNLYRESHMKNYHPEITDAATKRLVSLPQIVGMIQDIYDKTSRFPTSYWKRKRNTQSFSTTKRKANKKGRQSSSSDEDEISETEICETEDEVNSNSDEEDKAELPTKQPSLSKSGKVLAPRPKKCLKTTLKSRKTVEPLRTRGRPIKQKLLKVTDYANLKSNSEDDDDMDDTPKKSKRIKSTITTRSRTTVSRSSKYKDVDSDSDFAPEEFTSGSTRKPVSSRQRSLRNLPKRTSTSNRLSSAPAKSTSRNHISTSTAIDETRKLVLCLERCDNIMKGLNAEASSKSKLAKASNALKKGAQDIIIDNDLNSIEDEEIVVKHEIDEDVNILNMDILSHSSSNWQYVDMQTRTNDLDFHVPENDPFAEI